MRAADAAVARQQSYEQSAHGKAAKRQAERDQRERNQVGAAAHQQRIADIMN